MGITAVYLFKVALEYNKRIYRNIEILDTQTLDDFHEIIFCAFDRYDEHLYSFYLTKKQTKSLSARFNAPEYADPVGLKGGNAFYLMKRKEKYNAAKTKIMDLGLEVKDKMYYLFDFGDEWWHEITLLSIIETNRTQGLPRIVKKVGESPPQYPGYDDY
ncbi:IS1096 element passenger TnpR family protein [Calditrichota bacterium LG25]